MSKYDLFYLEGTSGPTIPDAPTNPEPSWETRDD